MDRDPHSTFAVTADELEAAFKSLRIEISESFSCLSIHGKNDDIAGFLFSPCQFDEFSDAELPDGITDILTRNLPALKINEPDFGVAHYRRVWDIFPHHDEHHNLCVVALGTYIPKFGDACTIH